MTMTYRCCAVVAALLLAGAAQAQGMGEPGAYHVSGGVDASNDSDRFNEFKKEKLESMKFDERGF